MAIQMAEGEHRRSKAWIYYAAIAVCVSFMGSAVFAPSAEAKPRATVAWSLPHSINEGASIPFSWAGHHLGPKHHLVIQKPEGTAHTWRTILRLSSNNGSGELPGMGLGKYRFRIADLTGHRVLAQQIAGIAVFGSVPLSTLFDSGVSVYATPTNSFPYVRSWQGEPAEAAFTVEHNHCQSVHIGFVLGSGPYNIPRSIGIITLVQESHDPVSASAPYNTIGSLDAELVPGQSWAINISAEEEQTEHDGDMTTFLNGYAICDSTESFFS